MPILKGTSRVIGFDLVTTAGAEDTTGTPTTQVSKDGGAFAATTNTAARIGSTGSFSLTLTATEMTADLVKLRIATTGDVPQFINLYPESDYTATRAGKIDNLDAAITSRMATFTVPTNFSASSIDSSGRVLLQPTQAGVTIPTVTALTNAVNTNANATETSIASLVANANQQANAQAGLTAQGYTTARAGYLDTLNGLVAAVWASATRTLSAFGFGVTVTTNNDKAGYTASTVTDKTGYTAAASNLPTDYQQRGVAVTLPALPNVTVGGYAAGQDPATLTWGAASRTLSASQTFSTTGSVGSVTGSVGSVAGGVSLGTVAPTWYAAPDNADIATILTDVQSLLATAGGALTTTQANQLASIATALAGFGSAGTNAGIARTGDVRLTLVKDNL